ncbi:MAG: hypothetical protein AAGH41_01725 [Pseudomonadota bacterium]
MRFFLSALAAFAVGGAVVWTAMSLETGAVALNTTRAAGPLLRAPILKSTTPQYFDHSIPPHKNPYIRPLFNVDASGRTIPDVEEKTKQLRSYLYAYSGLSIDGWTYQSLDAFGIQSPLALAGTGTTTIEVCPAHRSLDAFYTVVADVPIDKIRSRDRDSALEGPDNNSLYPRSGSSYGERTASTNRCTVVSGKRIYVVAGARLGSYIRFRTVD